MPIVSCFFYVPLCSYSYSHLYSTLFYSILSYSILSISLSLYPSIHLSLYSSIALFIYCSIPLSIYSSIALFIYRSIHLSLYLSIPLSLYSFTHLSICSSILSICIFPISVSRHQFLKQLSLICIHILTSVASSQVMGIEKCRWCFRLLACLGANFSLLL